MTKGLVFNKKKQKLFLNVLIRRTNTQQECQFWIGVHKDLLLLQNFSANDCKCNTQNRRQRAYTVAGNVGAGSQPLVRKFL